MMKSILILILFIQSAFAQWSEPQNFYQFVTEQNGALNTKCEEVASPEPPFSVSDANGMGWKTYENFRSKDNYRKKENIIPRRSIVKIKKGSEEYADHPDAYVPVEVLGVADTDYHDENLNL